MGNLRAQLVCTVFEVSRFLEMMACMQVGQYGWALVVEGEVVGVGEDDMKVLEKMVGYKMMDQEKIGVQRMTKQRMVVMGVESY